ncbi:SUV3 C-terminal domain-containing protein [Candidatus Magnetaquicoccus inordinatus]|uniref:SUV3 domain-containing protein n=1 Tax=Candidatus Magnetaquicoccus inordinatus TaxID=2496818 RepID=UPI00102C5611|nr:SUV3 C-terminal domain-containing protein [Candidatus Magnetaquicoccus inordinatus]
MDANRSHHQQSRRLPNDLQVSVRHSARLEKKLSAATRILEFHTLFPAREMRRHFTLFLGPTNSGKTYQALRILADARSGSYLAPLRLLALEVADTLNSWGVPCHMITGEERIEVDGALHSARTIEMMSTHLRQDVVVIDEAQMLGDADRGWAWTQAILGARAERVCIIGAPEAQPAIEKLLRLTEEPYEVIHLERLAPLQPLSAPVMKFSALEPGTALVAFSRAAVLGLKERVEQQTGVRVAVLYGALPPEVRRQQAELFASGQAPYLVATDAIGMGLNLPIRTLLFAEDQKFIDRRKHPLTPMEVRQIAGRAGRYGKNEVGFVGTFRIADEHILHALHTPPHAIHRAHLAPTPDHLWALANLQRQDKKPSLARLLLLFAQAVKPDPAVYEVASLDDQIFLAQITDRYPGLAMELRFVLANAPVPLRALAAVLAFERMVRSVAHNHILTLDEVVPLFSEDFPASLDSLETAMRVVDLYCWLHYRFPEQFPELADAQERRRSINREISRLLRQIAKPTTVVQQLPHKPPFRRQFRPRPRRKPSS